MSARVGVFATVLPVCSLVLLQGGYYGLHTCALGLLACMMAGMVWLRTPSKDAPVPLTAYALAGLCVAYAASALWNGMTLTTVSEVGTWASCAGYALLASSLSEGSRRMVLRAIAWFGVGLSVPAYFVAVGVIGIPGGMDGGRLDFTFQYANGTAVWFGVCALLCMLGDDKRLRAFAFLPVAGMLHTQSAGVMLTFVAVAAVVGTGRARTGRGDELSALLAQGALGVALFGAATALPAAVAIVLLLAVVATRVAMAAGRLDYASHALPRLPKKVVAAVLALLIVTSVCAAAALLPRRVASALYGAQERMCQVADGIRLWLTSPLLGVGPDNWQFLFPYVQTAPYDVSVVHSSPVQMLDDAGVLGLALFVAACVLGVRALLSRHRGGDNTARSELAATALLLAHATLDFDLSFGALAFLLALLLCGPVASGTTNVPVALSLPGTPSVTRRCPPRLIAAGLALALCAPLALCGLAFSASAELMVRASIAEDYEQVAQRYRSNFLARADTKAQEAYVAAQLALGNTEEVVRAYKRMSAPTDASTLCVALALDARGSGEDAALLFVQRLEERPYDATLVEVADKFEQTVGVDASMRGRFDEALRSARQRIEESWLTEAKSERTR